MSPPNLATAWQQQRPKPGTLSLDHVAHFVPDIDRASTALERLGFTLTPFSLQQHRTRPDGPLEPAGSGNRCAMLRRGYVEFLTPTSDTPVAARMRAAIGRYVGQHLICFGTSESARQHAHLVETGFQPQPPVSLQRQIGTETGEGTARFTVQRVAPEAMPEGRIQIVEHHTPELLWQGRWLGHANGAAALLASLVCVADVDEAAARFARFTQSKARRAGTAALIDTGIGAVVILAADAATSTLGLPPPILPWIAGMVLRVDDLAATRDYFDRAKLVSRPAGKAGLAVDGPPEIGGAFIFTEGGIGELFG
jgi:hypothetical protein